MEQLHTGQEQHLDSWIMNFKTKSTYGNLKGASLLDWPITLQDMEPYYTRAENAIGSHRGGRAALPANNNYKVFAEGAKRVGYKFYATGPYGTNAEPYDGVGLLQFKMGLTFKEIKTVLNGVLLREKFLEL